MAFLDSKLLQAPWFLSAMQKMVTSHCARQVRPDWGGLVWVYGTEKDQNPMLKDVLGKWNKKGTGGDKSGKLLTTEYFDDGRCYEMNANPDSLLRQKAAPVPQAPAPPPLPAYSGLQCQSNFKNP